MFRALHRFGRNEKGAVSVMFGLALVPLLGLVGASIDYSRASQARAAAASAADAAALEAAKTPGDFAARREAGLKLLQGNLRAQLGEMPYTANITPVIENGVEIGVRVTIQGEIDAIIMGMMNAGKLRFNTAAEATSAKTELSDVAFVLDTTDSMRGDRLASLKTATTRVIDDFIERRGSNDQIRVSVVPFAQYVNIGLGNRAQPWLDVASDYQEPVVENCRMVPEVIRRDCRRVTVPADPGSPGRPCMQDGVQRVCGARPARPAYQTDQCTDVHGPNMVRQCTTSGGRWVRWNGCVGSRSFPNETLDANYHIRIPGILGVSCGSPVLEPTTDLRRARTMINGLTTSGETYLPSGLIWGWRMLSTQVPIAARSPGAGEQIRRYMILVTDGQNTKSPTYPRHDGNDAAQANAITRQICQNMAQDQTTGIRLFTIAFEVGDPGVKALLQECSNLNGGRFFDAANASELNEALRTIGGMMSSLRLTR